MLDEKSRRRPEFVEGSRIRTADGREWSLPTAAAIDADPMFRALLLGLQEAETFADLLRAELALCIDLLTRNYELGPEDLQQLLGFSSRSPEINEFQKEMHRIAVELIRRIAR